MIDFRLNVKETPGIFQPNYRINNNDVEITQTGEKFQVKVGCQRQIVDKDNIEQMLSEIKGGRKETQTIKIIVQKGSTKAINSIKSVPLFMDESPEFLISKNRKIYSKETYELVSKDFPMENDFFTQNASGVSYKESYTIYTEDTKKLIHILTVIQDSYAAEL